MAVKGFEDEEDPENRKDGDIEVGEIKFPCRPCRSEKPEHELSQSKCGSVEKPVRDCHAESKLPGVLAAHSARREEQRCRVSGKEHMSE